MKVLTRYLAREFVQYFFLGLGAFSAIYLIIEFFERINVFLYNKATWPMMGAYFLNKVPSILFQVSPAAILLASMITLGLMARHNEVMAVKSGGISLGILVYPILGVVILVFGALLGLSEFIIPWTNQNARAISDFIIHKKKPVATFKQSQVWIHGRQSIYNIQLYHPDKNVLEGLTIYRFSPDYNLIQRVDARSAQWKEGKWVLSEASVTDFDRRGIPARNYYPELILSLPETPSDFQIAEKNPDEMNFRQLREYVQKIERDGYDGRKYRTAMHGTISFPFTVVIMACLGIPLALRSERGSGFAWGIGYSIFISFIYLVVYSFILELGKGGSFPPFLAAWLGNFIFAMVGVYLLLSVRH
jgi:lipopolysaccharide export system permease protein